MERPSSRTASHRIWNVLIVLDYKERPACANSSLLNDSQDYLLSVYCIDNYFIVFFFHITTINSNCGVHANYNALS